MEPTNNIEKIDFTLIGGAIDLEKSLKSFEKAKKGEAEHRIVWGCISNENLDEQGERLIQKALDWSYFDKSGIIKYEHTKNQPSNVIGFPHSRVTKGKSTFMKGALLPQKKMADEVWELIKSIEEYNRLYPKNQRSLQWSIEGGYMDGREDGTFGGEVRKAKVINVVITPNAINTTTFLDTMKTDHAEFAKSLAATPVSTDLGKKTGGDAIIKDEIDKKKKVTALNKKNSKKTRRSAKMYKSFEEARDHYLKHDIDAEKAVELAKSHFPDYVESEVVEEKPTLLKSITEGFKNLGKKVDVLEKSVTTTKTDKGADVEVDDSEKTGVIDASEFLTNLNKGIQDLNELIGEKSRYDFGVDKVVGTALDAIPGLVKSVESIQSQLTIKVGEKEIPLSKAMELVFNSPGNSGIDVTKLNLNIAGKGGEGDGTGDDKDTKNATVNKSFVEIQAVLTKGVEANVISSKEQIQAESAYRDGQVTILDGILKKCKTEVN